MKLVMWFYVAFLMVSFSAVAARADCALGLTQSGITVLGPGEVGFQCVSPGIYCRAAGRYASAATGVPQANIRLTYECVYADQRIPTLPTCASGFQQTGRVNFFCELNADCPQTAVGGTFSRAKAS